MTNIRRYDTTGRPVFITAVCHRRKPYLETDWQKELLLSVMREVKSIFRFCHACLCDPGRSFSLDHHTWGAKFFSHHAIHQVALCTPLQKGNRQEGTCNPVAAALLGPCDPQQRRSAPAHGLHPLQPGQTRICFQTVGL